MLGIILSISLISCEDTIERADTIKPVANYSATAESFQAEKK